jgi:hypothetical protein
MRSLVVADHRQPLVGIFGPVPDPVFAALEQDLDWLEQHGVPVERVDPVADRAALDAFPEAARAWRDEGTAALPLIIADGRLLTRGHVPTHRDLLRFVASPALSSTDALRRLAAVAVAAAIGTEEQRASARSHAEAAGFESDQIEIVEDEARRLGSLQPVPTR